MRTTYFQAGSRRWLRMGTIFLCAGALSVSPLRAGETAPAPAPAPADDTLRNWVDLTVGGVFVDGDKAQYQRRHWQTEGAFGGISDLHWEEEIGKKGSFKLDGHAIPGNEDYYAQIDLSYQGVGYIRAGYSQFRTWYDGNGGFFPGNGQFFRLYDNDFSLDRSKAWVELGLRVPNFPEITFRYEHERRDGQKDSTIWGDTALTGGAGTRAIVPTFLNIDENRDIFTLDIKHTIGNTDVGLGLRYETTDNGNTRNARRAPNTTTDRFLTQREDVSTDLFAVHFFTETRFGDKAVLTLAYAFTSLDSDISGSRIYGASYDPVFDPLFGRRQFRDEGYRNLIGGSDLSQHVAALNFLWTPFKDLAIVPSVRFEKEDTSGVSNYIETAVGNVPARITAQTPLRGLSDRCYWNVTESLELRYAGIRDWSLYASGEWLQEDGTENWTELESNTGLIDVRARINSVIFNQKYQIGAIWYPLPKLNLAAQYYYKSRNFDYDFPIDSTVNAPPSGDRYPAYIRNLNFETNDFNIRVTWRPAGTISFVSRYDFQLSTVDNRGDFRAEVQAADMTTHILSETVTWTPLPRLYFQGTVHYVLSETDTPAAQALPNVILNYKNDYWNGSVSAGFVIDDKTDLQATYFYYRADNLENNARFDEPYGVDAEEHAVTVSLSRQITKSVRGTLRYGYFRNRDITSGGFNSYDAHLVAGTLQVRF